MAQYEACVELIEEWDVDENIVSMTFDKTGSNTGKHQGACSRLERDYLEEKLFWFGCRHHVPELIAGAAWYLMFEDDPGPDNKAYQ